MNELNLHDLLDDLFVPPTHVADGAWELARARQRRRRGAIAAGAAAALVATVVVTAQLGSGRVEDLAPTVPAPDTEQKVWPAWDPKEVDALPEAPEEIAPELPDVLDTPSSMSSLAESPVPAAVLAVTEEEVAKLLATDGTWRSVPLERDFPIVRLSPAGSRMAEAGYADHDVTVHDLSSGESRVLDAPEDTARHEVTWQFLDDDTLLLAGGPTTYAVDAVTGEATAVPDGWTRGYLALDPEGGQVVANGWSTPNVLRDYATSPPRELSMAEIGRLLQIQVNTDSVVGGTYELGPFEVVVADRATLTTTVHLPIVDPEGAYANWGLAPLALADDGTVLLRVAMLGRDGGGFSVVAWDPRTNELWEVMHTEHGASVDFATDFLRR